MTNAEQKLEVKEEAEAPQAEAAENTEGASGESAKITELKDQLLRAMADAENTRRRAQKEREDTAKYAVSSFAKDLLPISDNLRRAIEAVPAEVKEQDAIKNLIVGIEAVERQLLASYERNGIKKIEPLGGSFDPNFHRVMLEVEGTGKPAGTVVQVLQAGYTIHDRLLREAMVGIAKAIPGEAGTPQKVDQKA